MNLYSEECEILALASGLERLRDNNVEGYWLVWSMKATERHAPVWRKKTARQLQERQDGFDKLSNDRKRVLGTAKWFNVRNGHGFVNRNDTHENIFVNHRAVTQNNLYKI